MARAKRIEINFKFIGTETSLRVAHMILVGLSVPGVIGPVEIQIEDENKNWVPLFDHNNLVKDDSLRESFEKIIKARSKYA